MNGNFDFNSSSIKYLFEENKSNYNLLLLVVIFFIFFLTQYFCVKLLSKIKAKKKKLNPRFWLVYSKFLPIFSFIAPIYYALKLEKFTKKDLYLIIFSNILYIFILFFINYQEKIW